MKRVKVDFSTTVRGGMVRASQRRATPSPLEQGEQVEAFDPEEGLSFTGVVADVDSDGKFAYLHMNWEPATPKEVPIKTRGVNYVFSLGGGIEPVGALTAQLGAPTIKPGSGHALKYAHTA